MRDRSHRPPPLPSLTRAERLELQSAQRFLDSVRRRKHGIKRPKHSKSKNKSCVLCAPEPCRRAT